MDNGASSYRRFLSGDDSGMVELIRDYKDGLLLYLNSFTHNLSLAEDCVQDTFIKLAIKKPKFREKSSFKTWLYAIGRNVTLDALRKLRHYATLDELSELSDMHDLEQDYLKEEQKIAVHRAICNLKQDYQQVIYLAYFENFSNDETAKVMHKTRKQIENFLYNARKALKSELEKEGVCYENL
ncbi:MAG: RNA polymerase sigma factor [Oscillospiraceae bacterium]|nr:RNA polymerase sigma factor [Oscillospiraceae bacterium]